MRAISLSSVWWFLGQRNVKESQLTDVPAQQRTRRSSFPGSCWRSSVGEWDIHHLQDWILSIIGEDCVFVRRSRGSAVRSLPASVIAWTILSFSCVTDFSGITGQGESSQTMKESWSRKRQSLSDNWILLPAWPACCEWKASWGQVPATAKGLFPSTQPLRFLIQAVEDNAVMLVMV